MLLVYVILAMFQVLVVENADDCVHITLPAPPAGHMDLSDDELSKAAGGTTPFTILIM